MQVDLPYWLQNLIITGREEGDDDGDDGQGDEGDEGDEGDDESDGGDEGGDDPGNGEVDHKKRAEALEESLRKERKLRRTAEREAKRKAKQKSTDQENKDLEATQERLRQQEERTTRLAAGLLKSTRDQAILDAARDAGFIDPSDALTDDIRNEVDYDQDEDDPSDIDIDLDSVKDAVAALARKKKHLVGEAIEGGRKSGGKFRKKSGSGGDKPNEEFLKETYPGLR